MARLYNDAAKVKVMRTKAIMLALVAIVGLTIGGTASAHMQLGNSDTEYCVSGPAPDGFDHVHAPGGAVDECEPPSNLTRDLPITP